VNSVAQRQDLEKTELRGPNGTQTGLNCAEDAVTVTVTLVMLWSVVILNWQADTVTLVSANGGMQSIP
jgi:hypothetical protein